MEIDEKVGRLEKILFLVIDHLRDEVLTSGRLDNDDKQQIANFYDEIRSQGK